MPIIYRTEGQGHGALYGTLTAWAERAGDLAGWRRQRSAALLGRRPEELAEHEWPQLFHALAETDAAILLETADPVPEWLSHLQSRVFPARASELARWIAGRVAEPGMLTEAVRHLRVVEDTAWWIDRALTQASLPEPKAKVWRLLATLHRPIPWQEEWLSLLGRVSRSDDGYDVQIGLAKLLRPIPCLRPALRWGKVEEPDGTRIRDHARIEFEPPDHVDPEELLKVWRLYTLQTSRPWTRVVARRSRHVRPVPSLLPR